MADARRSTASEDGCVLLKILVRLRLELSVCVRAGVESALRYMSI